MDEKYRIYGVIQKPDSNSIFTTKCAKIPETPLALLWLNCSGPQRSGWFNLLPYPGTPFEYKLTGRDRIVRTR